MRTSARFRVELHSERRCIRVHNALTGLIVSVDMAYLACTFGKAVAYDRLTVVLRCDECSVNSNIGYRLVSASVTVFQLDSCRTVCKR